MGMPRKARPESFDETQVADADLGCLTDIAPAVSAHECHSSTSRHKSEIVAAQSGVQLVPIPCFADSLLNQLLLKRPLVALSCLAPDIVTAIIEGRQSTGFTAKTIVDVDLPTDWIAQRQMLGFP